jgi:hypothetical protein
MIKTRSSHYITTSFISPLSGETCTSYQIQIYVWNGAKTNAPITPTFEITKENPTSSTGSDKINIARLLNDFIDVRPARGTTTEELNGNNQLWVKHNVLYATSDPDDLDVPQNIAVELVIRGYGYAMEGENPTTPTDKVLIEGREFNVGRNSFFSVPILIDEIPSTLDAINDTFNIIYQTTILDVLANDDLGNQPSNIALITTSMPVEVGTLEISNNTVVFEPGTGIVTPQTFTYTLIDSTAESDVATVTLNLSVVPTTITAVDDFVVLDNSAGVDVFVLSNDVLGTLPTSIISINQTGITSGTFVNAGQNLEFFPNGTIPISDETMTYTIEDATTSTDTATVTVQITSATEDNRFLLNVENTSTFETKIMTGFYSDPSEFFTFSIDAGEIVDINRCVIEATLNSDIDLLYTFDDNITC